MPKPNRPLHSPSHLPRVSQKFQMNQGTLSSIFFFFFFSSLHSTVTFSSSINPKFQACQPATCGSLTGITYPFYIQNRQQSFCGYPGFGISCSDNGLPIVNLFGKNYTIDEISYPNQSIRVFDSGFSISTPNQTSCGIPRLHNLTLQGSRFQFGPNQKYLFLVFGCDLGSLPKRWSEYRVGCSVENGTDSVLAMTGEGRDLREAAEKCGGGMVRTKVEDGTEEKGRRIEEVLRRGFVLNWVVSDCSQCKMTGGKCGFDADPVVYSFKCYCRDRDHLRRCNPDGKSRTLKLGLGLGLVWATST